MKMTVSTSRPRLVVHLSKNTIQKLSLTEKKIDFKKLTQEEILSLEN